MNSLENIAVSVTHPGKFHLDDVMSEGILKKIKPEIQTIRTKDSAIIANADLRFDVCGEYSHESKSYDHHQKGGAGRRENGVEYASAGLIWKHYSQDICDSKIAKIVDSQLIQQIDGIDSGHFRNTYDLTKGMTLSGLFSRLNPVWTESNKEDEYFSKAANFAGQLLDSYIAKAEHELSNKRVSKEHFSPGEVFIASLLMKENNKLSAGEALSVIRKKYASPSGEVCQLMNPLYREWHDVQSKLYNPNIGSIVENAFVNRVTQFIPNKNKGLLLANEAINSFNFSKNKEEQLESKFRRATDFARAILDSYIKEGEFTQLAEGIVRDAIDKQTNPNILIIPECCPYKSQVRRESQKTKLVIHPGHNDGLFYASGIPDSKEINGVRGNFPQSFRGLENEDLQKVSGVKDAVFCHSTKPMVVSKSLNGAIKLAEQAIFN